MQKALSILASFLLCSTAFTAAAAGQSVEGVTRSVEAALNREYSGGIMVLRRPVEKNSLVYDATGKMLKGGDEGPWTIYGRFRVGRVRLSKDSILFEGRRLRYWRRIDDLEEYEWKELTVQIKLAQPLVSAEEADAVLGQVFALTYGDVVKSAPSFWQPYLSAHLLHTPAADSEPPGPAALTVVEVDGESGVIKHDKARVGMREGVVRPRPVFAPQPDNSKIAPRWASQGSLVLALVVDATGKVREPVIVRPLGMGLDENAVKKVFTWRFDPGKVDGKAVAVELNVEISFNLY